MGIESTRYITREDAIERIKEIAGLFIDENYKEIEEQSFEHCSSPGMWGLQEFADSWTPINVDNLENWTDEMLGDYMDNSFFRYSMFENYLIEKEE